MGNIRNVLYVLSRLWMVILPVMLCIVFFVIVPYITKRSRRAKAIKDAQILRDSLPANAVIFHQFGLWKNENTLYIHSTRNGSISIPVNRITKFLNDDVSGTTILFFSSKNEDFTLSFWQSTYDLFLKLFPEKEAAVVDEIRRRKIIEQQLDNQ